MKNVFLLFSLALLALLCNLTAYAQFPNTNATYFPASYSSANQGPVSFVIGNKAYSGTGNTNNPQEFWEYDPAANAWTRKADFPGANRLRAVAFSIGNKGYIGSGQLLAGGVAADFWEYDPATNTWTQKASIPTGRRSAAGFSIGNKGYVGTGTTAGSVYTTDFWEFDPAANSWTQKADLPATARRAAAGFATGGKGYMGTGQLLTGGVANDFWEYDPVANSWTQKANFPGTARSGAVGAGTSTKGYIGAGTNVAGTWYGDAWEYNTASDTWTSRGNAGLRTDATGFAIDNMVYFGLGIANGNWLPSFVRLSPYWEVRNSTGDYDEMVIGNYPTCYQYALQYTGNWSGYVESLPDGSGSYAGFQVNSSENLGNICYRSRVDASATLRGGYGWYGGATQQQIMACRRNYEVSFQNQPAAPVGFRFYYTKQEIDNLICTYNATYGKNKTYSDLRILKYNGANVDLDHTNNSTNNSDFEQLSPVFTYYGNANQYVYAEVSVSSYSEFYLVLGDNALFVNDNSQAGDVYTSAVGNAANPGTSAAPFATLTQAIAAAQNGDLIYVDAGTYAERVFVNKSLYLKGAYAGVNPGTSLNRGASETIFIPSAENNLLEIFTVQSPNVTVDGFLFDGDNPAITGSITLNGVDVNAGMAIYNGNLQTDNLVIQNNIIKNFYRYGVLIQRSTTPVITGNKLFQNHVDNVSSRTGRDGRALSFFANTYGSITYNHMTRVHSGAFVVNHSAGTTTDSLLIAYNTIEAYNAAINSSFVNNQTSSYRIHNNQLSLADLSTWSAPGSSTVNNANGIQIGIVSSTKVVSIENNTITGFRNGVFPTSINTPEGLRINGGTISNSLAVGVFYIGQDPSTAKLTLSNINLQNNDVGIDVSATDVTDMPVEFSNVAVNGGAIGLRVYSPKVVLAGNTLTGISFAGQANSYIMLTYNAFSGLIIDATSVSFDGQTGAGMTLAQRFAAENKIVHRVDYNGGGFIRIKANEAYVTANSFISTLPPSWGTPTTTPDINRAVMSVVGDDTIHVDAGTYNGQVTLDKGLTIRGAGKDFTYLTPPAGTPVPPPGSFPETGLIQTAQNIGDVHISDLTATGSEATSLQCIILQTGGSVRNCRLLSGNQGIYFRTESATKTALIENNEINVPYIGVNCQGSGLTASLLNNEITVTNPGFSSGVFFGLDFGSLHQFTATGNKISNHVHSGFFGGANITAITQNSITGVSGPAIWKQSGTTIHATCNWYGTTDVNAIAAKNSGAINYSPWLVNGTDNAPGTIGFQPVPGNCTGRQNGFFVNDNSQTGDVLTTATGNNANSGLSSAPFATIQHAITQAQAGDTIYVDAGTYIENVNITKTLTLRGVKYGQQPGSSLDRGNESIVLPAVNNTTLNGCVFRTAADNITIDGFTVNGDNPAISGGVSVNGVDANAGMGIFNDNVFINNLTVLNNIVKNTGTYGIGQFKALGNHTAPAVSGAMFRYNRVDNIGSRGLVLAYNAYGIIKENHVTNCFNGVWIAQHSLSNPAGIPIDVSNNFIQATTIGMQASAVRDAAPNVIFWSNEVNMGPAGNGISVIAGVSTGVIAIQNKVSGGISSVFSNVTGSTGQMLFTNNSLSGYSSKSFEIQNNLAISATCNWLGTTDRTAVQASVLGNVNYIPWLTNGTDNDPAIGFQPAANSCTGYPVKLYVNDNDQSGDVFTTAVGNNSNNGTPAAPFATIDHAYGIAQPGDTIYADAGVYGYAGDLPLQKGITLLGSNYATSPNDATDARNSNPAWVAESRITGATLLVQSDNIRIKGFTLEPGARAAITLTNTGSSNNTYSNLSLENNRFIVSSNVAQVSLVGVGTGTTPASGIINSGFTISGNRFEKTNTSTGAVVSTHLLKNISIDNNAFVVGVTGGIRTAQAIAMGNTGVVDQVLVTNNSVDRYATFMGGSLYAGVSITGNKVYNTSTAFNVNNLLAGSSAITFSNNILDGSAGIMPFTQYVRNTGSAAGASSSFQMENNQISVNAVPGTTTILGACIVQFANTVLNPSSVIRGNTITMGGDLSTVEGQFVRGITVRGNLGTSTVENNEITLTGTNLQPKNPANPLPVCPAITLSPENGAAAVLQSSAVVNILNNKVHGYKYSFVVFDPVAGANPYIGFGNLPEGATVNVNNNSFTGDSISVNNGNTGVPVYATCNWYGSASAQAVVNKVSASSVNYSPWLTNGTDSNIPSSGFQPVAGSCNGTPVLVTLGLSSNVSCYNAANGSISVDVSGGVEPYGFAWTKDNAAFSTSEDLSGLAPGVYVLTVTDAAGSTATLAAVTITEPVQLTASATGTHVNCFGGSNGTASVSASGGTVPYSYLWSNGGTTASITGLTAGTYTVTVTDANGCTVNGSYTLTQPAVLTVTMSGTTASCNGSATSTPAGGTTPYTYLWNNGATTQTISNVPPGVYSVTVTDANGCTVNGSFTITGNSPINPSTSLVHVSCFGGSNGSITVTGAGGTAPHTYNLNGSPFQSNNVFSNLAAGIYVVGVKDANGCSDFVTRTINQPAAALTVILDSVIRPCGTGNNGRIFITASGGTGGKTYQWTGPNGYTSTAQDPNNLFAGNYSLTVTDNNGCSASLVVTLSALPIITITETITHVACRGGFTGAINATITGGSGLGFTYSWTGPNGFVATTEDISGLRSGNYTLTITDTGNGCTAQKQIVVTQPAANLVLSASRTNVTGCANMGTITASAAGGTAPYQFSVDGTNYQSSGSFTGLPGGNYTVYARDANGCIDTKALSITDLGGDEYEGNNSKNQAKPVQLNTNVLARIAVATDPADWFRFTSASAGSYTVSLNHATANFFFRVYPAGNNAPALTPVDSTATTKRYNLAANTIYYISITGGLSYNCYTLSVGQTVLPRNLITRETEEKSEPVSKLTATAYPNPHQGSFRIQFKAPADGVAKVELFAITGQKLAERTVETVKGETRYFDFTNFPQGTILYRVTIGKEMVSGKLIGAQ